MIQFQWHEAVSVLIGQILNVAVEEPTEAGGVTAKIQTMQGPLGMTHI